MTKIESLEKALILWKYIAEHGRDKPEAYEVLKLEPDYLDCPACQYASEQSGSRGSDKCDYCPIWVARENGGYMCENAGTPYYEWHMAFTEEDAKPHAESMATLIQSRLDEARSEKS